ncbi:helix-turn-helix domain-containing protein [Bifidobacterium parmae]|uniref:XRE family transcriptional regulator n=1 Tax=Bifidobacterium parmae TaxID=361854 RepID=A0A2N5J3B7_9BIFI|nr:helix-turn-helix transcriptional regulator [Bifidobacterium parmae]PLS28686.1 XRE family transcriptional regulator [Bifidobacterium parmae]
MSTTAVQVRSIRQLAVSLRDARRAAGVTQTELAERTGLSRPWISQLEQGRITNPGIQRIFAICDALGVNISLAYMTTPTEQRPTGNRNTDGTAPAMTATSQEHITAGRISPHTSSTSTADSGHSKYSDMARDMARLIGNSLGSSLQSNASLWGNMQTALQTAGSTLNLDAYRTTLESLARASRAVTSQAALLNGIVMDQDGNTDNGGADTDDTSDTVHKTDIATDEIDE